MDATVTVWIVMAESLSTAPELPGQHTGPLPPHVLEQLPTVPPLQIDVGAVPEPPQAASAVGLHTVLVIPPKQLPFDVG